MREGGSTRCGLLNRSRETNSKSRLLAIVVDDF